MHRPHRQGDEGDLIARRALRTAFLAAALLSGGRATAAEPKVEEFTTHSGLTVLLRRIEGAKSTEQKAVGEYIRTQTFDTIVGKVKFGANGEWEKPRVLLVQYQNIKGTDMSQFAGPGKRVVLLPEALKSGSLIYPYAEALK